MRFWVGKYLNNAETGIPYGTFAANILGSLLIGIVLGLAAKNDSLSPNQTLFLATGFCGGFTTFSTFSVETLTLLENGLWLKAAANVFLNVGACLIAGWLAIQLMKG